MKRFGVRGRTRYYGAGVATVAFVALTLFVVLPAFASNPGDKVPPASGIGNVTPVDVGVGGNQSCSSAGLFSGMTNVLQTTDPSPPSPGSSVSWPSGQGWNFTLTSGTLTGYSGNANKIQSLSVDSHGNAAIVGIAIKGGTDNLAYDYRTTTAQGWVSADTNLHAPASKWTAGTNPETGITQFYGISQLVICYKTPLAAVSGNAYKGTPGANNGISGLTVTLTDTTNAGTQTTTTDSSGNYSFKAVPGDNYTVCISNPSFQNAQSLPTTDTGSCHGTTGTNGYAITTGLSSTNGVGLDFGFQPYGTLSGTVYTDVNGPSGAGPDGVFESNLDSTLQGWIVNLYDGNGHQVGQATSDQNGQYSIAAPYGTYTACVTPGTAGSYAQTEPLPTAANSCANLSGLPKGQPVQLASTTTANFGVDQSVADPSTPCPPNVPFGGAQTNGELQIQLAGCKPFQTFVFGNGTLTDGSLWASVFAADQVVTTQNPEVPLIEKWRFPDPVDKTTGLPLYTHVDYTDVFPYDPAAAQELPQCKLDPRDLTTDPTGMTLGIVGGTDFTLDSNKGLVLPAFNPDGVTPATSCAISTRVYVDANGKTWLEVYAYSDIDSWGKSSG